MHELTKGQDQQRREYADLVQREPDPVRRALGMVRVSARDTVDGWTGFADHLAAAEQHTTSKLERVRLRKAAGRAREIARLAGAVGRDLEVALGPDEAVRR